MDKTLYTLKLGGNDVTLKFNIGFLKKLRDLSGKDPLKMIRDVKDDPFSIIELADACIRSGMLANDKSADVSKVTEWLEDMPPMTCNKIVVAVAEAIAADADPEDGKDTQPGASVDV